MKISVLHATARLPQGWIPAFTSFMSNCDNPHEIEYILCIDESDRHKLELPAGFLNCHKAPGQFKVVYNPNRHCSTDAYNYAASQCEGELMICNQDDVRAPEGWDTAIGNAYKDTSREEVVIHCSTGSERDKELIAVQILNRERYQKFGYIFYPEYESMYADDDFTFHAYKDDAVIHASYIQFEHLHPVLGKGKIDEVYRHENRPQSFALGRKVYNERVGKRISKQLKPTIAMCFPGEMFDWKWVLSWSNLLMQMVANGYGVMLVPSTGSVVYEVRGNCIKALNMGIEKLSVNYDYTLWLDHDNRIEFAQFESMLKYLEENKNVGVHGGWAWVQADDDTRVSPNCGYKREDTNQFKPITVEHMLEYWEKGEPPFAVEYLGFGCVMVKREVMDEVSRHFGSDETGGVFSPIMDGRIISEDVGFCQRVIAMGWFVTVDPVIHIPHRKMRDIGPKKADVTHKDKEKLEDTLKEMRMEVNV